MKGKYKDPEYMKKYRKSNKDKIKGYDKKYRELNSEKVAKRKKISYSKKKDYYREKRSEYRKIRKNKDPIYKLYRNLSSLYQQSFKNGGFKKTSKTHEILGCTFEYFKSYLESKFEPWMNWENKGLYNGELNYGWDTDHIIPISTAKTIENMIKLNHYTNLQPLCSKINRDLKCNKINYQ